MQEKNREQKRKADAARKKKEETRLEKARQKARSRNLSKYIYGSTIERQAQVLAGKKKVRAKKHPRRL